MFLASLDLVWLPRQRSEGGSLLRSAQDAHRVSGLKPQVRPGVRYHPLGPHDRQHGSPSLPPHREVAYRAAEERTSGGAVAIGVGSLVAALLGKPDPLDLDRSRGLP